jgi:hypothetical protein
MNSPVLDAPHTPPVRDTAGSFIGASVVAVNVKRHGEKKLPKQTQFALCLQYRTHKTNPIKPNFPA